uniref:Uncharacterized protein n=1 Tax=Avena sativa TaxID=4498 RepID=A0ACD5YL53_AVESA
MAAPADAPPRQPSLPEDTIVEILSRVGDAIAVVRCAATCKAWRRLILEPSFLSHRHAGPSPLLGFFFRDTSQKLPRRRLYLRRPTRFLLLGPSQPQATTALHLSHFFPDVAGLSGFAPLASGTGGLLALRHRPACSLDPEMICVCDPMAGTSTFLPPLAAEGTPFGESVVFLDADGSSFRLLAAMEYSAAPGILLRIFSSRTGHWGAAVRAYLPDNMVVLLSSPAVVHRGAVHWICGTRALPNAVHALAVRPGQAGASVCRVDLPLRAGIHRLSHAAGAVRLSSSTKGCLSLVLLDEPVISIWNLDDNGAGGKSWMLQKTIYLMSVLPSVIFNDPSAEWGLSITALCDQSGSLFLHAVGEGLFVLNLETEMMSKVGDGHCAKYLCPYVPDLSSCLGAMKKF